MTVSIYRVLEAAKNVAAKMDKAENTWKYSSHVEEIRIYSGYAENEGGSDAPVATANWNNSLVRRVGDILEKLGVEIEWCDEWTVCDSCNKAVRTQPDSYFWKPQYAWVDDCTIVCSACLLEDAESYLQSLEDNPDKCNCFDEIDPEDYEYIPYGEEIESEMGTGTKPSEVAKELRAKGITRFLFHLVEQKQFGLTYQTYIHEEDQHLLKKDWSDSDVKLELSLEEYREYTNCYAGLCLACGEIRDSGCEPDAKDYECYECGEHAVVGIELAMIQDRITFQEDV